MINWLCLGIVVTLYLPFKLMPCSSGHQFKGKCRYKDSQVRPIEKIFHVWDLVKILCIGILPLDNYTSVFSFFFLPFNLL